MKENAPRVSRLVALLLPLCYGMGCGQAPLLAEQPTTSTFRVRPETTFQTMVGFGAGFNQRSLQDINAIQRPEDRGGCTTCSTATKGSA